MPVEPVGNDQIDRNPRNPTRAAQYIRRSTDHQRYSTENQSDANHRFADLRGMQIVYTQRIQNPIKACWQRQVAFRTITFYKL
jgi:hypothetical protein